ncbi:AzlD domain-containing protein [Serinibacter arcticus]|nr:AzlD domain-containing protein [Serinibacter arcticus]
MTEVMIAVVLLGIGTYGTRRVGVALGGRVTEGPRARESERVLDHGIVALLVGVALTTAIYNGHEIGGWARPLGVACALTAAWLRAPLAVSVLLGAGVTAGLRLLGLE